MRSTKYITTANNSCFFDFGADCGCWFQESRDKISCMGILPSLITDRETRERATLPQGAQIRVRGAGTFEVIFRTNYMFRRHQSRVEYVNVIGQTARVPDYFLLSS